MNDTFVTTLLPAMPLALYFISLYLYKRFIKKSVIVKEICYRGQYDENGKEDIEILNEFFHKSKCCPKCYTMNENPDMIKKIGVSINCCSRCGLLWKTKIRNNTLC